MLTDTNLPLALTTVRPEDLTAYLGGTGWVRRKDFPRHDLVVFDSPAGLGGDIHVVFPASAQARDFPDHVERAVKGLADFEVREVDAVIFDIVNSLRGPGQSKQRVLMGLIVRLSAEPDENDDDQDDDEDDDRWVTLRFVDGGRKQHVRFPLDGENYRRACDAHRDGLRVSVGGMLEHMGKGWRLLSITQFSVVPGEPVVQE